MVAASRPSLTRFGRVAITHDWVTNPGGSEKVVAALLELFPQAEIFTAIYDPDLAPASWHRHTVHTSFLDRLPGARTHYMSLLPLVGTAFESFDLTDFDLVISSNHACAKNVITQPGTLHVCYCHTPMRYAWQPRFTRDEDIGALRRAALPFLLPMLRREDLAGATRPDRFVANSRWVAARIEKYYRREAEVVWPPVDVDRFLEVPRVEEDYYLAFGRLAPYKRFDLAVAACARLGRRLKVAGAGRSLERLRAIAAGAPHVELLGRVDDDAVPGLFAGARALLFPGEEDFGMVPVEAQAAGLPVIALGVGGVLDSVKDGVTGVLHAEQTVESLCEAIERFEAMTFDERELREHARGFRPERFHDEFAAIVAGG